MVDQILSALPARQLLRLLVELEADGAVDPLRFYGEGLYYILCPRLVSGAPQAADALWSEWQLHRAVDPRAELFAHLPHLGHHPEPREGAENQGRRLVVALPDAAFRLLLVSGPDDRETEGAPVRGGRAAARGADEHGIAHLPGDPDGVSEAWTECVAARHPDVAGRRCDRDGSRPGAPGALVEDGPHVAVGGRR